MPPSVYNAVQLGEHMQIQSLLAYELFINYAVLHRQK